MAHFLALTEDTWPAGPPLPVNMDLVVTLESYAGKTVLHTVSSGAQRTITVQETIAEILHRLTQEP